MDYVKQLTDGSRKFGIIGQGYVGLPLAEAFAEAGMHVIGFDIDLAKVESINRGESYIGDVKSENLKPLVDRGLIEGTADFSRLKDCSVISICVPTPLSKSKDPDVTYIEAALAEIIRYLQPGQVIVLESTTYPGTTDELALPLLEETGMKCGVDFHLAFSPERVDPGNVRYTVKNTPKIIGGVTPECTRIATEVYDHALEHVHPVSSTRAAELVKLLENSFRAINIGFINEMAMICEKLDVDVWEVIEASKTKPFGFMPFYPGPGLGGHCIPIDPLYLKWKLTSLDFKAQFIDLADSINSGMPYYVVTRVMEQLNEHGKALKGCRVLIMGMAYKENIDDVRESPALDVAKLFIEKGAEVVYHDAHVPRCRVEEHTLESSELSAELVKSADLVFIATGHSGIDYQWVVDNAVLVFDTKNMTGHLERTAGKVAKL
ncbi:MAG: nucleotide sugar dehydrogenase [bacterium]